MNEKIITICYGTKQEWTNRNEAIRFFMEGIAATDGSEQDRYTNILLQLLDGETICKDL